MFIFNLQLFTDSGTGGSLVNATGNYINAYTGHETAFTPPEFTMDGELKTFYDTELLENARTQMFYGQFGKKQTLPARHGITVEWRKWNTFPSAQKLKEGVIPTGEKFGVSKLTGSIDQYGLYTAITDELELHAYDDIILGATEEMGASASKSSEELIRDGLLVGKNVLYCDNINLETGKKEGSTPTQPSEMGAADVGGWAILTPTMVDRAKTQLVKAKTPKLGKYYVAVIHPSVAYDLRESDDWNDFHKYEATEAIFAGEIGELHGVRFIENPDAPVLGGTAYQNKASGVTYATYFFGKEAFGIIDAAGGNLQMIIKGKEQAGGPLNQFSTIGYKFEANGATILYPERMLRVMSTSYYSDVDTPNYSEDA